MQSNSCTKYLISSCTKYLISSCTKYLISSCTKYLISSCTKYLISSCTKYLISSCTKYLISSCTKYLISSCTKYLISSCTKYLISSCTKYLISSFTKYLISSCTKYLISSFNSHFFTHTHFFEVIRKKKSFSPVKQCGLVPLKFQSSLPSSTLCPPPPPPPSLITLYRYQLQNAVCTETSISCAHPVSCEFLIEIITVYSTLFASLFDISETRAAQEGVMRVVPASTLDPVFVSPALPQLVYNLQVFVHVILRYFEFYFLFQRCWG